MKRNKEKPEGRTLRQDAALLWRALKIWDEIQPRFWLYGILAPLASTTIPYFGLFLSSELINELAGARDPGRLFALAGIAVGGGFALSVLSRMLEGRKEIAQSYQWVKQEEYLNRAQNGFQYEHLEDPKVQLLRSQIFADSNAFGGGLIYVYHAFPGIAEQLFRILLSAALTVSMFTLRADGTSSGLAGWAASPAAAVLMAGLILAGAAGSVRLESAKMTGSQEAVFELAECNSRVAVYGSLWGADMIVFGLNRIVTDDFRRYGLRPEWVRKLGKVGEKYGSLLTLLRAGMDLALFLFVAAKAYLGAFGIGSFVLYQGTVSRFVEAVGELSGRIGGLRNNNRFLAQLYEYLDLPNNMYRGTLAVEKRDDLDYEIEFRDVSFRYPRTDAYALRHVSMKFRIGEKLAVVGENGSGKTTFIKLLCRLYDPTEGKILLNGIDITRYRYDEYLALFSVVFQDYMLFDLPIGENVAASPDYDGERVRASLIRAGLGEKLAALDALAEERGTRAAALAVGRGYDSEGIDLSGGERQKIALARALYKDAPFVVLDEPTAALDPIAEAAVYEDFNRVARDKTTVFISHRLSSCRFCQRILVFDRGRIVQTGSHEMLSEAEGKYRELWTAQAKYYVGSQEE